MLGTTMSATNACWGSPRFGSVVCALVRPATESTCTPLNRVFQRIFSCITLALLPTQTSTDWETSHVGAVGDTQSLGVAGEHIPESGVGPGRGVGTGQALG